MDNQINITTEQWSTLSVSIAGREVQLGPLAGFGDKWKSQFGVDASDEIYAAIKEKKRKYRSMESPQFLFAMVLMPNGDLI